MSIIIIFATVVFANLIWDIIDYCTNCQKKKDCEKLNKYEDYIIRGHINYNNNMNKQIVYKVDGDFNGDIKGENVTVILMGDGDINGDINIKNGEVFVHHGDINGDVKADKVLCPTDPTNEQIKHNPAKDIKPSKLPTRFVR